MCLSARWYKQQLALPSFSCPLSLPLFGEEGVTGSLPSKRQCEKAPNSVLYAQRTPWVGYPPGRQPGGSPASSVPLGYQPHSKAAFPHKHPQLPMERNDTSKPTGGRDVYPDEPPSALPEPGFPSPQRSPASCTKKRRMGAVRKPCSVRGKPVG